MDYFIVIVLFVLQLKTVSALSGHVCTRQRAEQYMTSYNKGFICPERYTTACGQLDWRRCTKYRVQTCYTPTERYATRYVTVEECCPGWKDAGGGSCTIPVCSGKCQNGGVCVDDSAMPTCKCLDGFSGDMCETERNSVDGWNVALICALCLILVILTSGVVVLYKRTNPRFSSVGPLQQRAAEDSLRPAASGEGFSQRDIFRIGPWTAWNSQQPTAPVLDH